MGKLLPIFQLQVWNIFEALLTFPNSNIKGEAIEVGMQLCSRQNQSIVVCTGPSLGYFTKNPIFLHESQKAIWNVTNGWNIPFWDMLQASNKADHRYNYITQLFFYPSLLVLVTQGAKVHQALPSTMQCPLLFLQSWRHCAANMLCIHCTMSTNFQVSFLAVLLEYSSDSVAINYATLDKLWNR